MTDDNDKCAICNEMDDDNDGGNEVEWVQCDICRKWFHIVCLELDEPPGKDDDWTCANCKLAAANKSQNGGGTVNKTGPNETNITDTVNDDAEKLKLMSDLIREKEELVAMKQKQLDLMERLSERNKRKGMECYTSNLPSTSKSHGATTNNNGFLNATRRAAVNKVKTRNTNIGDGSFYNNNTHSSTVNSKNYLGGHASNVTPDLSWLMKKQMQMMSQQYLADLPDFDGDLEMWPIFYQQFITTTEQAEFDDTFNLMRLRKALKGEALQAVKGILAMPNCLKDVMSILERRFGDNDAIVRAKIRKLHILQPPIENKPQTIKMFFEFILGLYATLKNANATNYLASPQTLDAIIEKLPLNMKRKWLRHKRNMDEEPSVENFINWFEPFYDCANEENNPNNEQSKRNIRVNLHKESCNKMKLNEKKSCSFCKKFEHTLENCGSFKKCSLRKRWIYVRRSRLCFSCLQDKHRYSNCESRKKCTISNCNEFHHTLLHSTKTFDEITTPNTSQEGEAELSAVSLSDESTVTHFRSLPVKLCNPDNGRSITVWAFLDEGSSPTMLCNDVADELQLKGVYDELCTTWTDDSVRKDSKSRRVKLTISGVELGKSFTLHNVRTVSRLNLPMPTTTQHVIDKYRHLKDIKIPLIHPARPSILIGLEHAKLGLMYEIREGKWYEPIGTRTRLGWVIHGKQHFNTGGKVKHFSCHVCDCNSKTDDLNDLMREFQTTESFGVKTMDKLIEAKIDKQARDILESTTRKIDTQYETGLLWKRNNIKLPDSERMATKRLICFEQKLNKDEHLKLAVLSKMRDHISNGYLVEIKSDEEIVHGCHWYLPIFSVQNPNKPEKIRLVFDAAAKSGGVSLNDMLTKGPDTLLSLFGIIVRFRQRPIAVSADIAEMFHRIKIMPTDQMYQLVLWRNCNNKNPITKYKMTRMTFGASCSPCSASYVLRKNANKFSTKYPRAVESIENNHYVDDLLDCFDSEAEALKVSKQIYDIHDNGGFQIRNWISNSKYVEAKMNQTTTNLHVDVDMNVSKEDSAEKVLGMFWSTFHDEFMFKLNVKRVDDSIMKKLRLPTKRELLKIMMSQFDPLGILSPVIIHAKIIMQKVWKTGVDWDDEIPTDLKQKWFNWLDSLDQIQQLRFPRWYCDGNNLPPESIVLHLFADASEEAFAAVAFLQFCYNDSKHVSFVAAKSRVAPQKSLSVPRLELQAAVMATRLKDTIIKELSLKVDEVTMWSDSQTVLSWIRSTTRRYSAFVSHRVSEILDSTTICQWRWVPSSMNIADQATRMLEYPDIHETWLRGPTFLYKDPDKYPIDNKYITETDEELKYVNLQVEKNPHYKFTLIEYTRFSKWERLVRSTAYVIKFVRCLKSKQRVKMTTRNMSIKQLVGEVSALSSDEINRAELLLFKIIQKESFVEEIRKLRIPGKCLSKSSCIFNLNPFMDDEGILRMSSRIDIAPSSVCQTIRQPIILSREHYVTSLLIDATHRKFHHVNKEAVVNCLRQYVWIPKIRVQVNRVVKSCCTCILRQAKPIHPRMAPLPEGRICPFQPPFSFTGLDFFGPIEITVGRRREKRWGVLFICLSSRSIHLELASSLNTSSAVMCVRNFINRRGPPIEMVSDNGTNLRAAEKELRLAIEEIDFKRLQESVPSLPNEVKTKWRFIPPSAPHFGGSWERMIQIVKRSLYVILKDKHPREETLRSALIEVENLVNSRPLYYSPNDVDNLEAITPNHLLKGTGKQVIQFDGDYDCRTQWRVAQSLATEFWRRWIKEYLPTISSRTKWQEDVDAVRIGQLVLINDDSVMKGEWLKGIISKLYPSKDGRIRTVEVRTAHRSYVRPVAKLSIVNIGPAL